MCCIIRAFSILVFARAWVVIRRRVLRRPEPSRFAPAATRPAPRARSEPAAAAG